MVMMMMIVLLLLGVDLLLLLLLGRSEFGLIWFGSVHKLTVGKVGCSWCLGCFGDGRMISK